MRRTVLPMLLLLAACSAPDEPEPSASDGPVPSASLLPLLGMPGANPDEPAGDYGWGSSDYFPNGMHHVFDSGETQISFDVHDDCFPVAADAEPTARTIAGLDGLYLEPYDDPSVLFVQHGPMTTGAYALPIDDQTLCVYLSWNSGTTPEQLDEAREVVESIRGQVVTNGNVRINFTLPFGWDTG